MRLVIQDNLLAIMLDEVDLAAGGDNDFYVIRNRIFQPERDKRNSTVFQLGNYLLVDSKIRRDQRNNVFPRSPSSK